MDFEITLSACRLGRKEFCPLSRVDRWRIGKCKQPGQIAGNVDFLGETLPCGRVLAATRGCKGLQRAQKLALQAQVIADLGGLGCAFADMAFLARRVGDIRLPAPGGQRRTSQQCEDQQ